MEDSMSGERIAKARAQEGQTSSPTNSSRKTPTTVSASQIINTDSQPPVNAGSKPNTTNGMDIRCSQASDHKHGILVASDRNGQGPTEPGTSLHVDLTTPPLTPRDSNEDPSLLVEASEQMNGNRNNVSDSVHASSSNFKSTRKSPILMSTISNKVKEQHHQVGKPMEEFKQNGSPACSTEPPALVIVENFDEDIADPSSTEGRLPNQHENSSDHARSNGLEMSKQEHSADSTVSPSREEGDLEQSSCTTTLRVVGKMQNSGEEGREGSDEFEDVEDMELILVEEEEEEEEKRRRETKSLQSSGTSREVLVESSATVSSSMQEVVGNANKSVKVTESSRNESSNRGGGEGRGVTIMKVNGRSAGQVVSTAGGDKRESSGERVKNGHSSHSVNEPAVEFRRSADSNNNGQSRESGKDSAKTPSSSVMNVKQAAKVKQFFTTIQQHGNKVGREVAEQVQELIHALMNETATVEEFHQEIQTITNYPLKDFIIPFLRDNIGYLRTELKESSQVLSDILGEVPTTSDVALTPQLADDELPVLSSSSKATSMPTMRTISSSLILNNSTNPSKTSTTTATYSSSSSSSSSSASGRNSIPHSHSVPNHAYRTGTDVQAHSHSHTTVVGADDGFETGTRLVSVGVGTSSSRKRIRRYSTERETHMSTDKEILSTTAEKSWPKRIRTDINDNTVIIPSSTPLRQLPPTYSHHPPPITHLVPVSTSRLPLGENHSIYTSFPSDHGHGARKRGSTILSEDWGHLEMMLSSVQGMVEKTRQSMAILKERVTTTQIEMERKEMERDCLIQQRVNEAIEKVKRQNMDEKQRLLMESSKQLMEAVANVKAEMEGKIQQAQALAVQEALKEASMQTKSKESCWNCGRRATETCSGCNKARYCGTYCQHKDWANHMHNCASGVQGQGAEEAYSNSHDMGHVHHHHQVAVTVPTATVTRGIPQQQLHRRAIAIPVNLVASPQEVTMQLATAKHTSSSSSQGHPEIIIKTEKT